MKLLTIDEQKSLMIQEQLKTMKGFELRNLQRMINKQSKGSLKIIVAPSPVIKRKRTSAPNILSSPSKEAPIHRKYRSERKLLRSMNSSGKNRFESKIKLLDLNL